MKKKLFIQSAAMGILLLLSTMAYNYAVDYHSVFRPDLERLKHNTLLAAAANMHVLQFHNYFSNADKFDSLFIGNSRVGMIDVSKIRGARYYNFWYPASIPALWKRDLRYMRDHGVLKKMVVIGVDDAIFRMNLQIQKTAGRRLRPFPYTCIEKLNFYSLFLTLLPSFKTFQEAAGMLPAARSIGYMSDDGVQHPVVPEKRINSDPAKHAGSDVFSKPTRWDNCREVANTIADMMQIKETCDAGGVRIVLFISPNHNTTYRSYTLKEFDEYLDFKRRLIRIAPFYDFSGVNTISENNLNWFETSHYRPKIGDMMLAKIFSQPIAQCPNDFGVLVTEDTIEAHLSAQRAQYIEYMKTHDPVKIDASGEKRIGF